MADAKNNEVKAAEDRTATDELQKTDTPEVLVDPAAGGPQVAVMLNTTFVTNGVKHGPGRVTVSEEMADELMRRQEYWNKVEEFRLNGKDYTVEEALAKFDAAGK